MCLAVPGCVIHISGKTASVDFGGIRRQVLLDLLPNVEVGEYVLVHAGFAIQRIEAKAAVELLAGFAEVAEAAEDQPAGGGEIPGAPEDSPPGSARAAGAPEEGPGKDTGR